MGLTVTLGPVFPWTASKDVKVKNILTNVNGKFLAGHVNAIMGPSGSGKTSCLNALSGRATYGKITGTVSVNGVNVDLAESKWKSLAGS